MVRDDHAEDAEIQSRRTPEVLFGVTNPIDDAPDVRCHRRPFF
jgi:hypothetical protein